MTNTNSQLIMAMLRQALAAGQTPFLTISSNSMAPLLRTGDQVGLEKAAASDLKIGDIITLEQGSFLLTHRFWGWVDGSQLTTRGDRPLSFDNPTPPNHLLGRVIVRRRAGKEVAFSYGAGRWLNRRLTWLFQAETRLLNLPLAPEKQRKLLVRLIHRKVYLWTYLLNASVTRQL